MLSRHRVSRQAIELIKRFEGYRQKAAQLPDGRWTIGYGHTLTAREGAEVDETDAEALLVYDLIAVQHAVNENVLAPLSQNQFDALCSFAFNIGLDSFRRSGVLKRLNAGSMVQAACAMELWRKADFEGERIIVDALVRRRSAEKLLFLTPDNGAFVPAPSPLLRPVLDLDAADLVPQRRPVTVEPSFDGPTVTARREDAEERETEGAGEPAGDAPPEPPSAVETAAEAVTGRLATLFADPGDDPAEDLLEPALAEPARPEPARPQADFAGPITVPAAAVDEPLDAETALSADVDIEPVADDLLFEVEPELEADTAPEPEGAPEPAEAPGPAAFTPLGPADADPALDIPQAPRMRPLDFGAPDPDTEAAPRDFIPSRPAPAPPPAAPSVVLSLMLALFGLAFFGFGVFWGLNARGEALGGLITPMLVAWLAGVAGVLFFSVAVYYLLQRIGREAERD